jgi:hypothetical protein
MVMDSQQQQPERRPEVGFACTSQFMVADAKGICMAGNPHETKKADVRGCGMKRFGYKTNNGIPRLQNHSIRRRLNFTP